MLRDIREHNAVYRAVRVYFSRTYANTKQRGRIAEGNKVVKGGFHDYV